MSGFGSQRRQDACNCLAHNKHSTRHEERQALHDHLYLEAGCQLIRVKMDLLEQLAHMLAHETERSVSEGEDAHWPCAP